MRSYASISKVTAGLVVIGLSLFAGCSDPKKDIMDMIENQVILPAGSEYDLQDYAKFYAYNNNGDIQVLYTTLVHSEGDFHLVSEGIEDYCSSRSDKYPDCLNDFEKVYSAKPGDSYWLEDYNNLPAIADGGCGVVEFSFLTESSVTTEPRCNGEV